MSPARRGARLPDGWGTGDRGSAYGTETIAAVDVIVGPGNLYVQEAKRLLSAFVGHRRLRRAERSAGRVRRGRAQPRGRARPVRAGRARRRQLRGSHPSSAYSPSTASPRSRRRWLGHPEITPAGCVLVQVPDVRAAIALADAYAPEHLQLIGVAEEAHANLVTAAGCLIHRRRQRHRIRRLRGRLQPRAADRRRCPLLLGALRLPLPPAHAGGYGSARGPRRCSPLPARRSPESRASRRTPSRCRPGSARINRYESHRNNRACYR